MPPLTHVDLCSGLGCWILAAESCGFTSLGCSEIDPYANAVLAERFPCVPNYGNLCRADFSGLRGRVTVLSMSLPCQPWSVAGQRGGASDDRDLWAAACVVIDVIRPTWILFENVPGILSGRLPLEPVNVHGFDEPDLRQVDRCGADLAKRGFEWTPFGIPAAGVGAPHLRNRIWIVAHAADAHGPGLEIDQPRENGHQRKAVKRGGGTNGNGFAQSGVCRKYDDVTPGLDRTQPGRSGDPETGEKIFPPPLTTERIPFRAERLKALGNAIVWPVTVPFFEAIRAIEEGG